MTRGPGHANRPKGTGAIRRAPKGGAGWVACGPQVNGRAPWLGRFNTYRDAEKALAAFLAKKEVA